MYRDLTTIDRSTDRSEDERFRFVPSVSLSEDTRRSDLENQKSPLAPNAEANPEFAKWWRRWVSRVRRISVRKNPPARGIKIDPRNSDPKAARSISAECEFTRFL
jgi:hypothetical protein